MEQYNKGTAEQMYEAMVAKLNELEGGYAEIESATDIMGDIGDEIAYPDFCYSVLPGSNKVIIIQAHESGYFNTDIRARTPEEAREMADFYNQRLGVTKAEEKAMLTGSMFGWDVPGANPSRYDKTGKALK